MSVAYIAHDKSAVYDPSVTLAEVDWRHQHWRDVSRAEAYRADITYGQNSEFGFDYLRDNMVMDIGERVQRELHYAIVDEVDSILIDEARTPLIISAPAEESGDLYARFAKIVRTLKGQGICVLLTDHNVRETLAITDRSYLIDAGRVEVEGRPAEILDNAFAREHYLGKDFRM